MAMFGRQMPRSPMTGGMSILPGDQPGLPPMPPMGQQAPDKPARWLEGGKFTWKDGLGLALGAVGDALSGQPVATTMVGNAFQHQRDLKQKQQQRQMELSDWLWKQQWERNNPKPVNNDTINDFNWYKGLSDEDKRVYQEMRPEYRQGPDGRFYRIDTAQTATPPDTLPPDFDFGGGGTGNGTGGFR